MSRRSTMSMSRDRLHSQSSFGDRDNNEPDDRRQPIYYSPAAASSSGTPAAASGNGSNGNGSVERAKRPDQQYYQTKRTISNDRTAVLDDLPALPMRDDDHRHRHQRRDNHRSGGGGGGRSFNAPTTGMAQRQSEPREVQNPFTRNLNRNIGRERHDSAGSSDTMPRVISTGGGRGGSGGGPGKGNGVFRFPDNYNDLPPRFKKKILQENGLDPSLLDKPGLNGKPHLIKTFTNSRLAGRLGHRSPDRLRNEPPPSTSGGASFKQPLAQSLSAAPKLQQQPQPNSSKQPQTNPPFASQNRRHQSFREPGRRQSISNSTSQQNQRQSTLGSNSNLSQVGADFRTSTRSLNQAPSECGSSYSKRSSRSSRRNRNRNRANRDSSSRTDRTNFTDRSCSPGGQSGRSSQMSQRDVFDSKTVSPTPGQRTRWNPFARRPETVGRAGDNFHRTDHFGRADSMSPSMMQHSYSMDTFSSLPATMDIVRLPEDIPNSFDWNEDVDGINDDYSELGRPESRTNVFEQIYQLNGNAGSVDDISASVSRLDLGQSAAPQPTQTQTLPRPKGGSSRRSGGRNRNARNTAQPERPLSSTSMSDLNTPTPSQAASPAKSNRPGLLIVNAVTPSPIGSQTSQRPLTRQETSTSRLSDDSNYSRPPWYDTTDCRAYTLKLIRGIERTDGQLQLMTDSGAFYEDWERFSALRRELLDHFEQLLLNDLKFCRAENVDLHVWKVLYYNPIETLKKALAATPDAPEPDSKLADFKAACLRMIEEGLVELERLLHSLEQNYAFKLDDFLDNNAGAPLSGLRYVTLALVSAQTLFLSLGDLLRYREQLNGGKYFGRSKQWYIKAQQLIPSNGKPYNQLAIISLYTKRKFDAVYYHMRSLTASNPIHSARESLKVLFDETRKKYENSQKKLEEKVQPRAVGDGSGGRSFDGPLRREVWIHPEGGRRLYRTAPMNPSAETSPADLAAQALSEELARMDHTELNKRFVTSYLHVHGKLITKIGMDTFLPCATLMLKELRALLQVTPIVFTPQRLVQMMALNMFTVHHTQTPAGATKSTPSPSRNDMQDNALSMCFAMFGLILDRFLELTREALNAGNNNPTDRLSSFGAAERLSMDIFPEDAKLILPAIKIWCDWLRCNSSYWNPPPSIRCFNVSTPGSHDPWKGLASLVTLLERIESTKKLLSTHQEDDSQRVRLPEDIALLGFTPLEQDSSLEKVYCSASEDIELVHATYRVKKITFYGAKFMCDAQPPVLRRIAGATFTEYKSAVAESQPESNSVADELLLLESFSDDNDEPSDIDHRKSTAAATNKENDTNLGNCFIRAPSSSSCSCTNANHPHPTQPAPLQVAGDASTTPAAICPSCPSDIHAHSQLTHADAAEVRRLQSRKDELQRRQRMDELNNRRLQEILRTNTVSLKIEVRPKYLVPDTNCFIDFHEQLRRICGAHPLYQLMVPLVVINELEGLSRGGKKSSSPPDRAFSHSDFVHDAQHNAMVASAAVDALAFLRSKHPAVRCITTKGSVLNSMNFTFEDADQTTNDDKILQSAANLCRNPGEAAAATLAGGASGETQVLVREVVLLTTDRNLRVKALAQNVPVRELPDFIKWSGLVV